MSGAKENFLRAILFTLAIVSSILHWLEVSGHPEPGAHGIGGWLVCNSQPECFEEGNSLLLTPRNRTAISLVAVCGLYKFYKE